MLPDDPDIAQGWGSTDEAHRGWTGSTRSRSCQASCPDGISLRKNAIYGMMPSRPCGFSVHFDHPAGQRRRWGTTMTTVTLSSQPLRSMSARLGEPSTRGGAGAPCGPSGGLVRPWLVPDLPGNTGTPCITMRSCRGPPMACWVARQAAGTSTPTQPTCRSSALACGAVAGDLERPAKRRRAIGRLAACRVGLRNMLYSPPVIQIIASSSSRLHGRASASRR